jgi:hypothetical protein
VSWTGGGEATVTVYPQDEGDEPGGAWWDPEGAALGTGVAGDGLKVTILRATGLLVDLSRVRNIYDAAPHLAPSSSWRPPLSNGHV